jgi:hypothetical protein
MVTTRSQYRKQSIPHNVNFNVKNINLHINKKIKIEHDDNVSLSIQKQESQENTNSITKYLEINENENKLIQKYDVNIDFDEASRVWRENKIKCPNGTFRYKKYVKPLIM